MTTNNTNESTQRMTETKDELVTEEKSNQASITLDDYRFVVRLIDECAERGAFKGGEMANIGFFREKYAQYVKQNETE